MFFDSEKAEKGGILPDVMDGALSVREDAFAVFFHMDTVAAPEEIEYFEFVVNGKDDIAGVFDGKVAF